MARRTKVISADAAAQIVLDGDTLATGGFVGVGVRRGARSRAGDGGSASTGAPRDLTLVFAAGQGDGGARGLNHFAPDGLVRRVIGGHWGLVPRLGGSRSTAGSRRTACRRAWSATCSARSPPAAPA